MIEGTEPDDWRALQESTARILRECGLDAATEVELALARGHVKVDVLADDPGAVLPTRYLCECKHWKSAVSKDVVHAFRTVVTDAGANLGLLISSAGFQSGATEAAAFSNVRLMTWAEFEATFEKQWFERFMAPTLWKAGDPLHEYTEPINSRIFRKADALPTFARKRFLEFRERYQVASLVLMMFWFGVHGPTVPELPLRATLRSSVASILPPAVLDAHALRPLMDAVIEFYRAATQEFDSVFGERA